MSILTFAILQLILLLLIVIPALRLALKEGYKEGYCDAEKDSAVIFEVFRKTTEEFVGQDEAEKFNARLGANFQSKITEIKFNKNKEENEDERN